jgi:pimeloyl-ACP methyl ester carboxylesterase
MPPKPVAVVFVHGLARKPAPEKLRDLWLEGLARGNPRPDVFAPPNEGLALSGKGVPTSFNYYADVFYGTDYETDFASYYERDTDADAIAAERLDVVEGEIRTPVPETPRERAFVRKLEAKLAANLDALPAEAMTPPGAPPAGEMEIASWLPGPVKQAIVKKAAMEAYYFLFDKEYERADGQRFKVRSELRARLLKELAAATAKAEKVVVVAHSMGTMVAYDVLRNCPDCPLVDTLITLGSPLGVREVQEELIAEGASDVDFPAAKLSRWINVYDPLDPVCGADPRLANDFQAVDGLSVTDVRESNWGGWRHTITHYLAGTSFRKHLRDALRWA